MDLAYWSERIFLANKTGTSVYIAFGTCRHLGYNCNFKTEEISFQLQPNQNIHLAKVPHVVKTASQLATHVEHHHSNFDQGMNTIGDEITTKGYGVIGNFCSEQVCWDLITFLESSGLEKEAFRYKEKICGGTYQTQTTKGFIEDYLTNKEPFINSPHWPRLKEFFDSLDSLGRMLLSKLCGWDKKVVFDGKLSFLTSMQNTGRQFPHCDQPFADGIQVMLVVSETAEPTLVIPDSKLERGPRIYSFNNPTDAEINSRIRCISDMSLEELEGLMIPIIGRKLRRGYLIVFCSDVVHAGPKNPDKLYRRVVHMTLRPFNHHNPVGDVQYHIGEVAGRLYNRETDGDFDAYMIKKLTPYLHYDIHEFLLERHQPLKDKLKKIKSNQQIAQRQQSQRQQSQIQLRSKSSSSSSSKKKQ